MLNSYFDLLSSYLAGNCSDRKLEYFSDYLSLLSKWNKTYNLTAITDPKEMVILHILDSLSIAPFITGERIIDVGSGAGLPGIPLAIFYPEKHWTLLDSNIKKTRFLKQAVIHLGLKNVTVVHERVEKYQPDQPFDHVTSRAFSALSKMVELSTHLLKKTGTFLAMKGEYPKKEIDTLSQNMKISVHALQVKGLNANRHLIKITAT